MASSHCKSSRSKSSNFKVLDIPAFTLLDQPSDVIFGNPPEGWYSFEEAAEKLECSISTFTSHIKKPVRDGKLKTLRYKRDGYYCKPKLYINLKDTLQYFLPTPPREWINRNQLSKILSLGESRTRYLLRIFVEENLIQRRYFHNSECKGECPYYNLEQVKKALKQYRKLHPSPSP